MRRSLAGLCAGAALLAAPALAAAQTKPAAEKMDKMDSMKGDKEKDKPGGLLSNVNKPAADTADVQDLIFFSQKGPVRLRLKVQAGSRAPQANWDAAVDAALKHFDRDGNGSLSKAEFERMPPAADLFRPATSPGPAVGRSSGARDTGSRFADIDTNHDGKITRDELAAYLKREGFGPLQVAFVQPPSDANKVTEILWAALDRDGDGKLSKEELAQAAQSLQKFDEDEDETVTISELLSEVQDPFGRRFRTQTAPPPPRPATRPTAFLAVPAGEPVAETAKRLLARCDKDKNGRLSREEIGLSPQQFIPFDSDQNGELDADELAAWLRRPPDLTVAVTLGGGNANEPKVVTTPGKPSSLARHARPNPDGGLLITLEGAVLDVRGDNGMAASNLNSTYNQQLQQYSMVAPSDGLTRKQVEQNPSLHFALRFFDAADRNGDGKLSGKELREYIDLLGQVASSQVVVQVAETGRELFDLMDTDHDRRLSPREQFAIGKVLAGYARSADGALRREDLPVNYRVQVGQGTLPIIPGVQTRVVVGSSARLPRSATMGRGPLWFRKMDRNRDGDLTPREFLGPPELFRQLDRDGDGLISLEEAELYEAERKDADKGKTPGR
jgi:Ca2+-binding EF-hand superfamily protein